MAKTSRLMIQENYHDKIEILIRLIGDIKPEFRPQTQSDWERFFGATEMICKISKRPITTTGNRIWLKSCSQSKFNLPEGGLPAIDQIVLVISDFLSGIREVLRFELMDLKHNADCELAVTAVVAHVNSSLGIEKLAKIGRKYAITLRKKQQVFLQERDILLGLKWISPLLEPIKLYKLTAVPLCTPADLIQESKRMKHCVDTYISRCMRYESQFWSFRREDGRPLSTFEVRVERNSVVAVEHRAASNTRPSMECISAAEALINHLRKPDVVSENYWHYKKIVANRPIDHRTMIALTKPMIEALSETLPKRISYGTLVEMARNRANNDKTLQANASVTRVR